MGRKYKHKYQVERRWDEDLTFFVFKLIGSTVLFFLLAVGIDVYRFLL